ncbi:MAG TPA: Spy/CpxP family protein refolding chaperone [Gemmatimonadales bacterium]|nr:Spy/CpxP family protein refolding chaperone [Gemmatimonadales bacterium]
MRNWVWAMVATGTLMAAPAMAQQPAPETAGDTALLRQRIEDRFALRVKEELGLDEAQASKLRDVARGWAAKRRGYEAEERTIKRALADQMRPGIAANTDSVSRLTQRLLDLRVTYAESYRSEYRELGFLTPVQRAQFVALRERVLDSVRRMREERRGAGGPGARWQAPAR